MLEVSQHITTTLETPEIQAAVTGGIFWELADEDADYPFMNFSFKAAPPVTKEGIRDFEVNLRVFAKSLTSGATIAGVIQDALKSSRWRERGYRSGYTDNEAKEAFIELTYQFKY